MRLLFVALLVLAACGPGSRDSAPLRVGTTGEYPPFTFIEGGKLDGLEIDFAQEFAESTGRELELVQIPLAELIPALIDGRIDVIMSGMSATDEREAQVDFTDPYLQVGQMALVRSAELDERSQRDQVDLPATRIGFRTGTTGEQFVRSRVKQAQTVPVETIEEGIQALRDKRIDYFVHDAPTIWRIVGGFMSSETDLTGLYRPLTEEYLAWAVRKGDRALAEQLNASLAQWRADGQLEIALATRLPVRKIAVD